MNIELQRARKRQMFIFLLVCFGMLALLGRAYYWQVVNPVVLDGYTTAQLANMEHIKNRVVNAPRGLIYDSNGHLLVSNVVRDDVYIEPIQFWADHADSTQATADLSVLVYKLHQLLNIPAEKLYNDFKLGQGKYPLATYAIALSIDPAKSQQLRASHLSYVFLEPHPVRVYPGGTLAAQILGYVGPDPNTPDKYIGFYGIEQQYNTLLSGKPGSFTAETDLNGNPLTVGASSAQQAVNGANLTLTIDSTIQYDVEKALADRVQQVQAQSGTAIVINVHTGAIVAMAGVPTFNPNPGQYGTSAGVKGCENQISVYFNPALYCMYEPGSTMKAVTMAAGLDQGVITPDTTLDDEGIRYFQGVPEPVTNWNDIGYGTETMTGVLEHSANVGAAFVAYNELGKDRFYPYLQRFGFGQRTGIGLPNLEALGSYRTPQDTQWTLSDLTRQAFGQSIAVTPLQLAMAYQAIANGGVMMHPYLVATIANNGHLTRTQPQVKGTMISSQADQQLIGMLNAAANYNKQATFPGYSVAVKTGTATTQGVSADQTVASMAGFLPASNPQYVILVKIDRPQATIFGGTAAAPVWKQIAQELMWYYNVPPDLPMDSAGQQ